MNDKAKEETFPGMREQTLSLEVTTRCNGYCAHCFARAGLSRHFSLSVTLAKEIITEGYEAGYRRLHITGGEPLLWKGLFETLDHSYGIGYKEVFINTNGTLLTGDINARLTTYKCLSISVSLDGTEVLHDRLRGEGSYKQIIRGVEKALDAGVAVYIYTTVRKALLQEIQHFAYELYRKFPGIKNLMFIQLIRVADDVFDLSEELLEPEDFLLLVKMVALLNLFGFRCVVNRNPLTNVVSKLIEMPWIPPVPPLYYEGSLIVMANRHISVVHSNRGSFDRYRPGMIRKVLASDAYRKTVAPDETTCPSCKYAQLCRENGMIRPSEWFRAMRTDIPYCKRVLERIIRFQSVSRDNPEGRETGVCRKDIQQRWLQEGL
jgi:MoaA/NifB/PqqE/SkfB family radical SAM enzyme